MVSDALELCERQTLTWCLRIYRHLKEMNRRADVMQ
jgi:hypothetical protein